MHIKQISIQGFKTYKQPTVIAPLSEHTNVVVGRNGSGKSNFFAAIRFVLSDAYTHMLREERQGLIYEGLGSVMSAYVEIVFDNSDRRFPIESEEVAIRRTIGLKKDDYSLNRRSVQRSDVMSLLENAGFLRSNPYYIVAQGRVTALTNAKDSDRLALVKEVAGAEVFDGRLRQLRREMAALNAQRDKTDEMLASIEERLADLGEELEELERLQRLEKEKKALEYALYECEVDALDRQIGDADDMYSEGVETSESVASRIEAQQRLCMDLETSLLELERRLAVEKADKDRCEKDVVEMATDTQKERTQLEEMQNELHNQETEVGAARTEIEALELELLQLQQNLEAGNLQISNMRAEEENLKQARALLTAKQRALYAKESRKSKFRGKEDRDAWLREEMARLNKEIEISQQRKELFDSNLAQIDRKIKEIENHLETSRKAPSLTVSAQKSLLASRQRYSELIDQRKTLWRTEARLRAIRDSAKEELEKASRSVAATMDRSQAAGLLAARSIAKSLNLQDKVYGTLGELIEVNPKYKTAAEVVAGNSLFHVVVDSDATASALIAELTRQKSGRVTFIPLNRVSAPNVTFPPRDSSVPLALKIARDPKYEAAVLQVFGRALVTKDLESGAALSREYGVTAVTLSGDRVNKMGVLQGGYRDHSRSRVDALALQRRKTTEFEDAERELHEITRQVEHLDSEIVKAGAAVARDQKLYDGHVSEARHQQITSAKLENQLSAQKAERQAVELERNEIERKLAEKRAQVSLLREELGSDFAKGLSNLEVRELQNVTAELRAHDSKLGEMQTARAEKEQELASVNSAVLMRIQPRLEALREVQVLEDLKAAVRAAQRRLEALVQTREELERQIEAIEVKISGNEAEIGQKRRILEKNLKLLGDFEKKLGDMQTVLGKSLLKKQLLIKRRNEVQKKIRDLGVLPESVFTKYSGKDSGLLAEKLATNSKELAKYSHVNRKALEQHKNFLKQRNELFERREELERSRALIEELILVLSARKGKAIRKTYFSLSKGFSEVFEELVPQGRGRLVLLGENGEEVELEEEEVEEAKEADEEGDIELEDSSKESEQNKFNFESSECSGVSIQVSFNSKSDEQQRIEQLLGGQKSLCAIALILAIQKCDPAPFYLFDEVDANLDTQYRTDVAKVIKKLSKNAQFICTTFRPELLEVGDKFFGILYEKKISRVTEISREDAEGFVSYSKGEEEELEGARR